MGSVSVYCPMSGRYWWPSKAVRTEIASPATSVAIMTAASTIFSPRLKTGVRSGAAASGGWPLVGIGESPGAAIAEGSFFTVS